MEESICIMTMSSTMTILIRPVSRNGFELQQAFIVGTTPAHLVESDMPVRSDPTKEQINPSRALDGHLVVFTLLVEVLSVAIEDVGVLGTAKVAHRQLYEPQIAVFERRALRNTVEKNTCNSLNVNQGEKILEHEGMV